MTREVRRPTKNLSVRLGESSLAAQKELEKQGLGEPPERPAGKPPVLPEELTDLHDRELIALMVVQSKWIGFLGYQVSAARVDERFARRHVEKLTAMAQVRNKGGSVSAMKAEALANPDLVEAKEKEQEAFAYRELVEALYNAVDKDEWTCSRELTRRTGRADRDRRRERWGDR